MHNPSQGSVMSPPVTRSQTKRAPRETSLSAGTDTASTSGSNSKKGSPSPKAKSAKKEDQATADGLKWAPTRPFDFTIMAKEDVIVKCHKDILRENSTFFNSHFKKPSNRYQTSVRYDATTVKTFLEYCYNNNLSAATPELLQMSLEFGNDNLTSDLIKGLNDVEIWRQVYDDEQTDNYKVEMWVKNLALDKLMKAFFGKDEDLDTVFRSGHKIDYVEFFTIECPEAKQNNTLPSALTVLLFHCSLKEMQYG